jgi:tellurite resistance protein TehA-like permease
MSGITRRTLCVWLKTWQVTVVADPSRVGTRASNFACITVAVVIIAAAILPQAPSAALFLWALGTGGQFVLFLTLLGRWIAEPTEILHATPTWLVPIVGNVTATLPGVPLGFSRDALVFASRWTCLLDRLPATVASPAYLL